MQISNHKRKFENTNANTNHAHEVKTSTQMLGKYKVLAHQLKQITRCYMYLLSEGLFVLFW